MRIPTYQSARVMTVESKERWDAIISTQHQYIQIDLFTVIDVISICKQREATTSY